MADVKRSEKRLDVIVAGAGPVGLALALALARAGRQVLVLEKNPGTSEHSRAPAVWPRTQEILHDLGVYDAFARESQRLDELRLWDADAGRALIRMPLHELAGETDFAQLMVLPQSRTEALLLSALNDEATADVLFSSPLTEFSDAGNQVIVTYEAGGKTHTAHARFLMGCDGAHSRVREALGLRLEGKTYGLQVSLADVTLDSDTPFPALTNRGVLAVGIRISEDVWRLILPFSKSDGMAADERINNAARNLFGQGNVEVIWQSDFNIHQRISPAFVRGRVALAGDAAHLNSPVGGQGMNAGLQDAEALARVLLEALDNDDPGLLDAYESARRQSVKGGVNTFTDLLTRAILVRRGRLIKPILKTANLILRIAPLRQRFLRRLAMLENC